MGIGDLELLCEVAPLQIGNYVWLDLDNDGVQDPDETPIAGTVVELWADTTGDGLFDTRVGVTATNGQGNYIFGGPTDTGMNQGVAGFSSLPPDTAVEVRISLTDPTVVNYLVTEQGGTGGSDAISDLHDSDGDDGVINAGYTTIQYTTSMPGENNHTLDFGFFEPEYDLALIKTVTSLLPTPARIGTVVSFDIIVMNQGNVSSGTYTAADTIPAGMTFVSATPAAATDPGVGATGPVTWVVPATSELAPGAQTTFTITVQIADVSTAPFRNEAEITADSGTPFGGDADSDPTDGSGATDTFDDEDVTNDQDPLDSDDSDFALIPVPVYDLSIDKALDPQQSLWVVQGQTVNYDIVVANDGNVPSLAFSLTPSLYARTGQTVDDLRTLIDKTLLYPVAHDQRTAAFVSDGIDDGTRRSFGAISTAVRRRLPGWQVTSLERDSLPAATVRKRLTGVIENGRAMTVYFGHSDTNGWGVDGLIRRSNVRGLDTAASPTAVIQSGCWNTYYVDPRANTLAHHWLLESDHSVAIVMGATTLTEAGSEQNFATYIMNAITEGNTYGEAVLQARQQLAAQYGLESVRDLLGGFALC